jgi:hypothetical protein
MGTIAEMCAGAIERGLRNVEHGDGVAAVNQTLSEERASAAHVDNVSRAADLGNELKRQRWFGLGPAQAIVWFGLID